MNKVFCSIFAVSALMVSTAATAHSAPMSGNYAIEMRGYTPDQMPASATGLAPFPAPEAAIGVLNLNKSGTVTGELIYSTGTSVTAPTTCGDTGAPCFNGSSSTITGGTFTLGANGLGTLSFTDSNSGRSFIFAVVVDAKGREFRGTSTPAVADEATAPILAIVGEKQGHIRASSSRPEEEPLAAGSNLIGNFGVTCNGQGVQGTGDVTSILGPGTLSITGVLTGGGKGGKNTGETGTLTLNGNNGFITSIGSQLAPPSFVCAVTQTISTSLGAQRDGTINASQTLSGTDCALSTLTQSLGLGNVALELSAVEWGSSNQNAFAILTQFSITNLSTPPAVVATCELSRQ